ncbi:MAG: Pili biogenesis protein ATPase [Candidatus Roizmanbacteria bacterium GW2011_GWC2_34_23]|uniref:Pili biogenesis protein ATPase n=1 Tax=Candidatus Roizmanbacteria bacterium GW2011_GWC2_34_23 TaxID=1618484 RepID=A0A0G0BBT1_9BACT|nr:MAG: Pili biogenesis protein ATPase [Candidatus Roizmanbacteria bacterium GW2011_GWC2_34_23]
MDLSKLLQLTIDKKASDLHMVPSYFPTIRVNGEIFQLTTLEIVTPENLEKMLISILNQEQKEILMANREIDLAYKLADARFRVNLYYAQNFLCGSFRYIQARISTLEELSLPALLHQCTDLRQGLVLLTGPTGEGKSTTLASLVNEINQKYAKHIITIEDPIEYVYPKYKSIISQRELHQDTHSWTVALKSALREDPDVILVGEMRDFETISLTLTAAETGHLVFSTLHTNSAPESIDRVIDAFPPHQQNQIKNQLAVVLKMVITQRLIPKQNSIDRIPAVEILINNSAISNSIREGKTFLIASLLLEKNLLNLYRAGIISKETAYSYAIRPKEIARLIK